LTASVFAAGSASGAEYELTDVGNGSEREVTVVVRNFRNHKEYTERKLFRETFPVHPERRVVALLPMLSGIRPIARFGRSNVSVSGRRQKASPPSFRRL